MFHIVLVHPEIPPNTGNVMRLCANAGARLHLVRPLGFSLDDRALRRAGLDYREFAEVAVYDDFISCRAAVLQGGGRLFALRGAGRRAYHRRRFAPGDAFVFGCESAGLDDKTSALIPRANHLRIPMRPNSRSLNLANAAAVVLFEAWRQNRFCGGE
jgi:tRNA (cytidine/uridine-2'-O-)-methyltransferase